MIVVAVCFHLTVQTIDFTTGAVMLITLKLERGVVNTILDAKHFLQLEQDWSTLTQRHVGRLNMRGESIHPTSNTPYMQVMDIAHFWNLFHVVYQGRKIDVFGSRFQKNVRGFAHNPPSSHRNEHRNPNGENRVHRGPTCQEND